MRKAKGFTLVELLVVIAIIALLMGILMPALARVRAIAQRIVCGTNLAGIGKAMLIYANDYEEALPLSGINMNTALARNITNWAPPSGARVDAFGTDPGAANVTSCFFALIKFAEATPKSFVCKADSGVTDFKFPSPPPEDSSGQPFDLIDVWDFGPVTTSDEPDLHCSYSYHRPFSDYPLNTASEPGMAVAADPSPWWEHAGQVVKSQPPANGAPTGTSPSRGPFGSRAPFTPDGSTDYVRYGNANPHQEDGQNVLFLDGHVSFENKSYCGVEEDNIYTIQSRTVSRKLGLRAIPPLDVTSEGGRKDSYLIMNRTAP